jgi:hypothetical protein
MSLQRNELKFETEKIFCLFTFWGGIDLYNTITTITYFSPYLSKV